MSQFKLPNSFRYTKELLITYREEALKNAGRLIAEAEILNQNGHIERTYFLAVAAIEEIGKAAIIHQSLGRNLKDSAVTYKIKSTLENHAEKINMAFYSTIVTHTNIQDEINGFIKLMIDLSSGREPSMYTDLNYESLNIQSPHKVIKSTTAKDCLHLSNHCYTSTKNHISTTEPTCYSNSEDAFFSLKKSKVERMFNDENYWWYIIDQFKSGNQDISKFQWITKTIS
ncbi:AbiV family abortive infection protein [Catenovulum agarivorans]|uniref:AbiV family abortive infection protein n=1 Tax=Catenovulum agarivorans TaxID=1172192 RepID=UPI00031BCA90|nr:AbiV family abortive infection protein [Catenovulum agarivorans]